MPINRDRKRVIGTFTERMAVLDCAEKVLKAMESSGFFNEFNLDSFRTTIVSFYCNQLVICWACVLIQTRNLIEDKLREKNLANSSLIEILFTQMTANLKQRYITSFCMAYLEKKRSWATLSKFEGLWPTVKEGYFDKW